MTTQVANISEQFLNSINSIDHKALSEENLVKIKECILDYIAAHSAGRRLVSDNRSLFILNSLHGSMIDETERSYENLSTENKVFFTGIVSHAAELDDGTRFGMIHPGAPVLSLLLPIAKKYQADFETLALAILVGYEAAIRLAMAMAPGHYAQGYHPTATCGAIGAAMGLAKLMNLPFDNYINVLSVACLSASGTLKVIEGDSEIKPFNVGNAALNGLFAVKTAMAGFKGGADPLGGNVGFFKMMTDDFNANKLIRLDSDHLLIKSIYFKPYAACRHAHAPIEAAISLRDKHNINADLIKSINVYVYETVIGKHDGKVINNNTSAKMSIPYAVAVAILNGKAGTDQFEEPWVGSENVQYLLKRVDVIPDEYFTSLVPDKRCSRVEIFLTDGSHYVETVEYAKGEPENPMTKDDLLLKLGLNFEESTVVTPIDIFKSIENMDSNINLFYNTLGILEI